MMYETSYLPHARFPDLREADLEKAQCTIYSVINIREITKANEQFQVTYAH